MTTKEIGGTVVDLAGGPIANAQITVTLKVPVSFRIVDSASLVPTYTIFTLSSGLWSATVECNDTITPAGTIYEVKEDYSDGGFKSYFIEVPSSLPVGVNQVLDLMVPELVPVGTAGNFLTEEEADLLYASIEEIGIPGPIGPPGPPGPTGGSASLFEYSYNTTETPPPASGTVRSNSATVSASTIVWVHRLDSSGTDRKPLLLVAESGDEFYVQDLNDSSVSALYRLTADPVDAGDYITFAVSFEEGAGAFSGNPRVLLGVIVQGPPGPAGPIGPPGLGVAPGGTPGQVLSKESIDDYDTNWIDPPNVGGATTLDGLLDVTAPGPSDGQVLTFKGASSQWEPGPMTQVTVDSALPSGGKDGDLYIQTSGAPWTPPAELPRGIVAWKTYAVTDFITTSATVQTPIAFMQLDAVPLKVGRLYEFSFNGRAVGNIATAGQMRVITPSAVPIANTTLNIDQHIYVQGSGLYVGVTGIYPFTVTVDANYNLLINAIAAIATVRYYRGMIMVKDIGPVRGQQ